jgi:hypothetical protein
MKTYDFDAVVYDDNVLCVGCLPDGVSTDSDEVSPIFAGSEWEFYPVCVECGEMHSYMSLLPCGYAREAAAQGYEVFYHDGADVEPGDCWTDEDGEPLPSGWYWWSCQPGCLPDGEPNGPFGTEEKAAGDALGF